MNPNENGPRQRLIAARMRSGKSEKEVANIAGTSPYNYYDLECHDSELYQATPLFELRKICEALGIKIIDLFTKSGATEGIAQLADEIRRYLNEKNRPLAEFEEAAGWEVGEFIDNPNSALELPIDWLRDVCRELGVDWVSVVISL
jgi:transcriptional regulator with XRE-family HTH domain